MMKDACSCYDNKQYGEILFFTLERTRKIRDNLVLLYELLPCKEKCKDVSEVLCYLQKELAENLESTQTLIECFNPDCFVCTPDTIFANILETDCLTEGALGQVSYINLLVNTPPDTLCQELAILRFTIEVVALSYRFLQNALRTFYCESSCYKTC